MGNKTPKLTTEMADESNEKEESLNERERFHRSVYIHETTIIEEEVEIGEGSKIWHYSHVCRYAKIGKNVTIGDFVYIGPEVEIGDNSKIQNHVSLFEGVQLGERVFVGPGVMFTNVKNPRAFINRRHAFKHTAVMEGVTIGANATILCGVSLGRYCFVGAGAVVTRDVGPFSLVMGTPAEHAGWMSIEANSQVNRPGM